MGFGVEDLGIGFQGLRDDFVLKMILDGAYPTFQRISRICQGLFWDQTSCLRIMREGVGERVQELESATETWTCKEADVPSMLCWHFWGARIWKDSTRRGVLIRNP